MSGKFTPPKNRATHDRVAAVVWLAQGGPEKIIKRHRSLPPWLLAALRARPWMQAQLLLKQQGRLHDCCTVAIYEEHAQA